MKISYFWKDLVPKVLEEIKDGLLLQAFSSVADAMLGSGETRVRYYLSLKM